jgi:hypothetical protein
MHYQARATMAGKNIGADVPWEVRLGVWLAVQRVPIIASSREC